jgi:hypothetical protein
MKNHQSFNAEKVIKKVFEETDRVLAKFVIDRCGWEPS